MNKHTNQKLLPGSIIIDSSTSFLLVLSTKSLLRNKNEIHSMNDDICDLLYVNILITPTGRAYCKTFKM